MANTVKMKQSAVAGKVPTTAQLALGELAINTVDGKLFLKKNVAGTETIVDVTGAASGVSSFNTRTGAVTLQSADVTGALGFTPANNASPALTGTPTAPTAAQGTNTTQLATTAFVQAEIAADAAPIGHVGATGTAHGVATTAVAGFMAATDKSKLDGIAAGAQVNAVTSVAGRTGAVTLAVADVSGAAPLASPGLTGTPTAPTAAQGTNTTQIATTAFVQAEIVADAIPAARVNDLVPASSVVYLARNTAPTGWLKANGAAVSRTTYAALFAAIGTTFGAGDGSTTFNLPDLRGEFPRGWDDGRGVDSGRTIGSSQAGEIQSHDHPVRSAGGAGSAEPIKLQYTYATQYGTTIAGSGMVQPVGGAETRPRNVALLACIKY